MNDDGSRIYEVRLDWFNGDDSEWTDVEADSLEAAARKVWREWHPTGWTSALVSGDGGSIDLSLEEHGSYEAAIER